MDKISTCSNVKNHNKNAEDNIKNNPEKIQQNNTLISSKTDVMNNKSYYLSREKAYMLEKYGKEMFKNTPQEMTAEERLEKLSKLQYNDVINLFNQIMTQGQGQVSVTGPFSKHPELKQEIFNNLAYYHTVQPKDITLENVYTPVEKSKVYTTETNKNQATILEGFKYQQNRNVKDSVCIELLEYILGGSPSSRLFSE